MTRKTKIGGTIIATMIILLLVVIFVLYVWAKSWWPAFL